MPTEQPTLTDFLLARIAEDEEVTPGFTLSRRDAAECKAKRRIAGRHKARCSPDGSMICLGCCDEAPCADLRDLALPYADHPDYRQEWRVEA